MTWIPYWRQTSLERAGVIARESDRVFRVMWSSMWPTGHCTVASLCLAPLLRSSLDVDFRVAVGRAGDCKPHAWVEGPDGDIVDPTFGQFDDGTPLRVLDSHHADELGHCPEILLTLDQEENLRRSIKPKMLKPYPIDMDVTWAGWSASSAIKSLFHTNYPHYAVA